MATRVRSAFVRAAAACMAIVLASVPSAAQGTPDTLYTGLSNPYAIAVDDTYVYWIEVSLGLLQRAPKNGGGPVVTLESASNMAATLALDDIYVYYALVPPALGSAQIRRVPKAGGATEPVQGSLQSVGGIALDASFIYFSAPARASGALGSIWRFPRAGGGSPSPLTTAGIGARGIALAGGYVYWNEDNVDGCVRRVPVGGGTTDNVMFGTRTGAITTDGTSVYWSVRTDAGPGEVWGATPGDGAPWRLAADLPSAFTLAADATHVFWVDSRLTGTVKQVASWGGDSIELASALSEPVAVAVDDTHVYWVERASGTEGSGTIERIAKGVTPPDVTAPGTAITSAPPVSGSSGSPAFAWSGSDDYTESARLRYAYRLDPLQATFSAWSQDTSAAYTSVPIGTYTFYVKARDAAGNEDASPASHAFTVTDVTPPETILASGPSRPTSETSAEFTWTGTDNTTAAANLVYAYRLFPVESSFSAFGPATSRMYTDLASGEYIFSVKARDTQGNEDPDPALRHFVVAVPNDPLLGSQWHLESRAAQPAGANARAAWSDASGWGVTIAVVDDGVEGAHPDLSPNYALGFAWDFNDNDPDASPTSTLHSHGTAVAGLAAARGSNSLGVAGVAPFGGLTGLRLIAAPVSDATMAAALTHQLDVDVFNNSWGPADNGSALAAPGPLTQSAIEHAIAAGRPLAPGQPGLGRIFVWSAGNGRVNFDSCSFDGFATQRFAIAVGAVADDGSQAWYSEACPALFVSAPSNGGQAGLTTTDLVGSRGATSGDYRSDFGGTSGAAPIVAGVAAMMLERNPLLTWRDVQYILAQTAVRVQPSDAGWTSGTYAHSEKYGFGLVDAAAAVDRAARWVNVGPEQLGAEVTRHVGIPIPDNSSAGVTDAITIAASFPTFLVEHVEVEFDATHTWRGDLEVTLTSPLGIVSRLAPVRLPDSGDDFRAWKFRSVRDWGRAAHGTWTLSVADRETGFTGTWNSWTLRVYGRPAGQLTIGGVSPNAGSGASQTFTLQYGDTGVADIKSAWVWFNATFASSAANSCLVNYNPISHTVSLLDDAGTTWHSARLDSPGLLENNQCAIATGASSAAPGAGGLTLSLAMTFKAAFSGAKNVFLFADAPRGIHTGWQQRGTWTVPGAGITADSVAPSSGSGATQTFSLQYSDTFGATDIATAWAWFNSTLASSAAGSCLVHYDRAASALRLINDAGTAWLSAALGSGGTLQNSQCAMAMGASAVVASGNVLTLTLAMTFKPVFSGAKNVYLFAASAGGSATGWQPRGTWTVPAAPAAVVTADSLTPASGTGASQTFALQYSDTFGAADLATAWVWFNATFAPSGAASCLLYYEPSTNTLRLLDDAGTTWLPGTVGGGGGTLQNSQCAIAFGGSSAIPSGTTLTLSLAVTFTPAFSGAKSIFMYAASAAGPTSGWQTRGTWTVPGVTVTADSATPASGAGLTQTFALQYADSLGASDLSTVWVWFHATFASSAARSCLVYYEPATNTLRLIDDAGSAWLAAPLGSGGTLQNSQCSIALAGASATPSGTTLTLTLPVTFSSGAFGGAKSLFMYAAGGGGATSGWQTRGSWSVP